jgi:hypothetical protein
MLGDIIADSRATSPGIRTGSLPSPHGLDPQRLPGLEIRLFDRATALANSRG